MDPIFKNTTDAELLKLYIDGHQQAFRELVTRYKDVLYAFLRRFFNQQDLIEDVFQETFLQLYISSDKFDLTRPLKPWLFTIAANKAKDALRKRKRASEISIGTVAEGQEMSFDEVFNSITSDPKVPYDDLASAETATNVREIVANMPDNLREILILAYFNKFSYKQMTEMLSIPIGTVKSRLHTAVDRFSTEWKKSFGGKSAG